VRVGCALGFFLAVHGMDEGFFLLIVVRIMGEGEGLLKVRVHDEFV
jgi:hypothetical protein